MSQLRRLEAARCYLLASRDWLRSAEDELKMVVGEQRIDGHFGMRQLIDEVNLRIALVDNRIDAILAVEGEE